MKYHFRKVFAAITLSAVAASAQAQHDPDAVANRYIQAANAGDKATIRDLIAEDVARSDFAGCTPTMDNKACLLFYIQTTVVDQHGKLKVLGSERHGDEIHAKLDLRTDGTRHAGVQRALGTDVIGVRNGKIVSFRFVPDFGDEQTAVFFDSLGIEPRAVKR